MTAFIQPQVHKFLGWLLHQGFVVRDELPAKFQAPLAVACATDPPLVTLFNTLIVDEAARPHSPLCGIRLTMEGEGALAFADLLQIASEQRGINSRGKNVVADHQMLLFAEGGAT